jgi:hypothetical protein
MLPANWASRWANGSTAVALHAVAGAAAALILVDRHYLYNRFHECSETSFHGRFMFVMMLQC